MGRYTKTKVIKHHVKYKLTTLHYLNPDMKEQLLHSGRAPYIDLYLFPVTALAPSSLFVVTLLILTFFLERDRQMEAFHTLRCAWRGVPFRKGSAESFHFFDESPDPTLHYLPVFFL